MTAVLVWDAPGRPPVVAQDVILWRSDTVPGDTGSVTSLPRWLEERAERIRARYLAWIHDLGNTNVDGVRIIDHLELRPGLSYWWMGAVAHKANFYESPFLNDVMRCLALEDLFTQTGQPLQLELVTANDVLATVLEQFCASRRISFTRRRRSAWLWPRLMAAARAVVAPLAACLFIAALAVRCAVRFTGRDRRIADQKGSTVALFDVFVHLEPSAFQDGRFASQYWTRLVPTLADAGVVSTWMHMFFRHREVPSLPKARAWLRVFTATSGGRQRHALIEAHMTPVASVRAARDYVRLVRAFVRLMPIRRHFVMPTAGFDFWPFYRDLWRDSMIGAHAMRGCARLAMYEAALARMPRQALGLYILENQPWEMALLHAWRANGHGTIIGLPHAMVRFWDLRYFYAAGTWCSRGRNDLPMPNAMAVNGPMAQRLFREAGYPEEQVVAVEALRYLHLHAPHRRHGEPRTRPCVLICGDNVAGSNERLVALVAEADTLLVAKVDYLFKPHKAASASMLPTTTLTMGIRTDELPALVENIDLVVTGNLTAAGVDARALGATVAYMEDPSRLNASPFRGLHLDRVFAFASAVDLAQIIGSQATSPQCTGEPPSQPFFVLDPALPRWRRLLGLPHNGEPSTDTPSIQ